MKNHFELSDTEFEKAFSNCSLNPELFSHEAHLRLAWIHICNLDCEKAVDKVCEQLMAYVSFLGVKDKFNKTLTVAAVRAVNHFMGKSCSDNFRDFMAEFPRLKNNFRELMAFHYRMDIYNSSEAKENYLEPDLLPFG
ncbi:MAG TPA: hypothetical protein VGO45_03865 [Bacteroidia bacterium]|jgi:hypothetical protein|nr:hypothetical protein [Bacteroidia bacterium]